MTNANPVSVGDPDLAAAIKSAGVSRESLRVEIDGEVYTLQVQRPYDPEKAREAIEKYAGSWSDLDADQMIADLYEAREKGSRPVDRP